MIVNVEKPMKDIQCENDLSSSNELENEERRVISKIALHTKLKHSLNELSEHASASSPLFLSLSLTSRDRWVCSLMGRPLVLRLSTRFIALLHVNQIDSND